MPQGGLTIEGDKALAHLLKTLPGRVQRRVVRGAVTAAMRPVTKAARRILRARSQKETREEKRERREADQYRLHETIGQVTRTYPATQTVVVASGPVYGAKYGHKGNIGHLIEKGHEKVLWGRRVGGRVSGIPFMEPAFDQNKGTAQQVLRGKVWTGIEREVTKLRKS